MFGHIRRMEQHRVAGQALLQRVKPASELLFGDVPDLNVHTAIKLVMNRVQLMENKPSRNW